MTKNEKEIYDAFIECVALLRSHYSNHDCDEDGHKHNTYCRSCDAKEQIDRVEPIVKKYSMELLNASQQTQIPS